MSSDRMWWEYWAEQEMQMTRQPCPPDDALIAAFAVENPPMAKTLAQRQADFRKAMKDAGFVRLEAYVTKEQRDKFRALGGDEWLRKKIEAAKAKEPAER